MTEAQHNRWRGPYFKGALLFATIAGGAHFFVEADAAGVYKAVGFKVIQKEDGSADWVTPPWFPIRRISDDDLESNEIEFQMRVNAVIEVRDVSACAFEEAGPRNAGG